MASQQSGVAKPSHDLGTSKGEEQSSVHGKEPGRHSIGQRGNRRPAGISTPRDVTSINPDDRKPIDPASPYLIPA